MNALFYLLTAVYGEFLKICCRLHLISYDNGINKSDIREQKLIVSLTSYGRRVEKVVGYTICSLMRQSFKPDEIILWLDSDNWNIDNIPGVLRDLCEYGLSIKYCDNIRSFKKLIPALLDYPNDIIVTCDDDMWYCKSFLEGLYNSYISNPDYIHSYGIKQLKMKQDGRLDKYNNWSMPSKQNKSIPSFAVGYCGCLYKKDLLYEDVIRKELFIRLCSMADDVWFFFMEYLAGTRCVLVRRMEPYPIDFFYQYFHKGSSLASVNCEEDLNDIQIKSVMDYYGISPNDLWQLYSKLKNS